LIDLFDLLEESRSLSTDEAALRVVSTLERLVLARAAH
jgi:hypothetical protein